MITGTYLALYESIP